MKKVRKFFAAMFSEWGSGLSGPASVPFVIAALWVSGPILKLFYGALAVLLGFFSAYSIWSREYDRAEREIALNAHPEIIPEIQQCFYSPSLTDKTKQLHRIFVLVRLTNFRDVNTGIRDVRLTISMDEQTFSAEANDYLPGTLVYNWYSNSPGISTTIYGADTDKIDLYPLPIRPDSPLTRGVNKDGWLVFTAQLGLIGREPQSASVTLEVNDSFGDKHSSKPTQLVIRHATFYR